MHHATVVLVALAGSAPFRQGRACSCIVGSPFRLLTPADGKAAPLNARVRAEVPAGAGGLVLQRLDGGEVPAATRAFRTGGLVDVIELTPRDPLAPATRYRVAQVDPARHPATVVFGSFQTGDAVDKAPPRLEPLGQATGRSVRTPQGSACEVEGPWVEIEGVRASDAGRPEARLPFGIWAGDAVGRVDATKSPADFFGTLGPAPVVGLPPAIDVGFGESITCALTSSRDVYCWGRWFTRDGNDRVASRPSKMRVFPLP